MYNTQSKANIPHLLLVVFVPDFYKCSHKGICKEATAYSCMCVSYK